MGFGCRAWLELYIQIDACNAQVGRTTYDEAIVLKVDVVHNEQASISSHQPSDHPPL